ncbi:Uncharacterized protein conserved in archaea [Archaeoglobus sulfaticallidus PM70-1]|uniref:Uncharacterized protein conserved in archaea n=1 Tax=Archaeoglobus sulfaticallidus PM70-1 TaxID=387631 RepID=N0BKH5_9EURY|nr:DUF2073 domain-containing protein [Archaeoglobus sulfaticallidus]AGK60996.1 Uncharacterized protein conserved in archaea [Archaeoglobus sulfaticallidus PM70-1]
MEGVPLNLISKDKLERMSTMEKLRMILDEVKEGKIVVLESGLSPEEEAKLIELTMLEIDHENFVGIEVESYPRKTVSFFQKIFGKSEGRLTLIGPANRLKTLEKHEDQIKALVQFM